LLHVGVCCKSLVSQALLKGTKDMDIIGPDIGTVRTIVHYLPLSAA
jgi:hypothetical protein